MVGKGKFFIGKFVTMTWAALPKTGFSIKMYS